METRQKFFGRISGRIAFLDVSLGWVERAWSWLPQWMRGAIGIGTATMVAAVTGLFATAVVWIGGFATDYGALAVLTILGAAGAATQMRGLADRLVGAMDRLAETRRLGGPPPMPLTEDERQTIQDIRRVWRRHGHETTESLRQLFQNTQHSLRHKNYMSKALEPVWGRLKTAIDRMETAVAMNSEERYEAVRSRFTEVLNAYLVGMKWLSEIDAYEDMGEEYEARLIAWRTLHVALYDKIEDMVSDPRHFQQYKIFVDADFVDDAAYASMIRWLSASFDGDVPTLSAFRTARPPRPALEEGDPET